jgi:hypothetical protein
VSLTDDDWWLAACRVLLGMASSLSVYYGATVDEVLRAEVKIRDCRCGEADDG